MTRWLVWLALASSLALSSWSAQNRIPWSDEGWFSSPSYNLAFHGYMGTTVLDPHMPGYTRIDQRTYWVMPLFLIGQGLWFKIFPHTVLGTRWFSILWGPIAALGFGTFLSRIFNKSAIPLVGSMLLLTSFIFIDVGAFSRPDMMCMALGLCGIASYVWLRSRSLPLAFLVSNFFAAASGMSHPNGIFHFLALWVCIGWFDRKRINLICIAAAAVPYLLFGSAWAVYILQDKQAFLDQFGLNGANGGNGRLPAVWNPFSLVLSEITERYFIVFGLLTRGVSLIKLVAAFSYLGSLVFCLCNRKLREQPGVQLLLLLFLAYFASMCVFNQKLTYYIIHILPVYIAMLAVTIVYLWDRWATRRFWIASAVVLFTLIEMSGIVLRGLTRSYIVPQREVVKYINSHSRPGDSIYGTASLLYEMNFDPRLVDDSYLGSVTGRHPDVIIVEDLYKPLYEGWSVSRPQVMVGIRKRLSEYRLAKQIAEYDVYLRPERIDDFASLP